MESETLHEKSTVIGQGVAAALTHLGSIVGVAATGGNPGSGGGDAATKKLRGLFAELSVILIRIEEVLLEPRIREVPDPKQP